MKVSEQGEKIAKALNAEYSLKGRDLTYQEVFSVNGLLPAIVKRADQLASLCLGYGLGITIRAQDKTMLNKTIEFDSLTPNIIRIICITDVLIEFTKMAKKNGKTPLDELLVD
jgi:intracellular multiplication protein IcmS